MGHFLKVASPLFLSPVDKWTQIVVCNKTESVIVNFIIGHDRYQAQSTPRSLGNWFSETDKRQIFLQNVNRKHVHLLNGCQARSKAQDIHSS